MKDIKNVLEELEEKKQLLNKQQEYVDKKEQDFKDSMTNNYQKLDRLNNEVNELSDIKVKVKISDLLNELMTLSETPVEEMCVRINSGQYVPEQIVSNEVLAYLLEKKECNTNNILKIQITGFETKGGFSYAPIYYEMYGCLDLYDIEPDGKTLLEHLDLEYSTDTSNIGTRFKLEDSDALDIYCSFSLDALTSNKFVFNRPEGLLKQAVINCYERNNSNKVYTKKVMKTFKKY